MGPPAFWDTVVRLPGLTLEVGEECAGCGNCTDVCPVQAIRVEYGRARVSELCKGCGRCAEECPLGAITLRMQQNIDPMEGLLERIEQRTDIGRLNGNHRY
jgi:ferredoxin